ncbi:Tartrate-resistant acid phosphatase type 5 [Babesia sp. Xinjiang]|uniref:Tartrate-resistant acid phosphatase type 5 n=1 Tax=Babesia sp. Xinjiang TaxID=462227 RepID=UPI000A21E399|nr:Tartrate-resistant acid phosphatase type 5 [Babesia sp. Xinjiang]ORM41226.1 Tartrate-resistant acid phosphatase type 5 [Babesia sp. Xinjiang]
MVSRVERVLAKIALFAILASHVAVVKCQLRFASVGNWGTGSKLQKKIAETLKSSIANDRVTFIVSPGSNFEYGVTGPADDKWEMQFQSVYRSEDGSMEIPMFTVLGAGDWQGDFNAQINRNQQAYLTAQMTEKTDMKGLPRWTMPNWWYHYYTHFATTASMSLLKSGHKDMSVGFIFIDTWILSNAFPYKDVTNAAWADLKKVLEIAPRILDYIIVVGDKPIQSSGPSKGDSQLAYYLLPLLREAQVDAYISGYDHDMEIIDSNGISLIVTGNGGSSGRRPVMKTTNSLFFSEKGGFCIHELNADGMETKFVNGDTGEVMYTHKQPIKKRQQRQYGSEVQNVSALPNVSLYPIGEMASPTQMDAFIKIVGTIGLIIAGIHITLLSGTTLGKAAAI